MIGQSKEHSKKYSRWLKRLMDVVGSCAGIAVFSPLFIVLPLLIKIDSKGTILYRRKVVGKNGITVLAYKFRTMMRDADKILENDPELNKEFSKKYKLRKDPRVTRMGRFLRKYSLDEIPQLINVLKGEMSLVGPRMMTGEELEKYDKSRDIVLSVKPGLTGLWQVSGRQNISPQRRMELDIAYAENWSCWKDIGIILRTFWIVVKAEGAY